ncbi:hypothetical protein NA876_17620 [Escherichia coli]|nr:hypothetical protein [Escherichia coli]
MDNNNRPMFIIRNGGKTNLKKNKTSSTTLVDIDKFDELNAEDNVAGVASVIDGGTSSIATKPAPSALKKFCKWFWSALTALAVTVLGTYFSKFF